VYVQRLFEEKRIEVLHDFIRTHSFGVLTVLTAGGLDANHIPFELLSEPHPFGTLRCHVSRANPLWREFKPEVEVLVVFHGPNAYISPSWYPSKNKHGKVAPSWNYVVVHAKGSMRVVEDCKWLRTHLDELTNRHEAGREEPWKISDAPEEFTENLLNYIVGIEIPIAQLVGKWQVSQQHGDANRQGVMEGLLREGCTSAEAIAKLVGESRVTK
jgi:transcriptional regulator